MKEIRRRYGSAVRAEVAGELMQSSFFEAMQQEDLSPAGQPNLEVVKMDPGIDFEFTATFEVFPTVELTDLSRARIKQPEAEITDPDLEAMIEQLREQRKTWEACKSSGSRRRPGNPGFRGSHSTVRFSKVGHAEDTSFVVGAGQMIDDFDKNVSGMTAGEEGQFEATFPDDYRAEQLKGKTVTFSVKVKEVEESKLPELDDEFFKGFGVEEGGIEAFRADVRANMQREMDAAASKPAEEPGHGPAQRSPEVAVTIGHGCS